jgi:phosphoenolpyruvate carboxykinase (ATP)
MAVTNHEKLPKLADLNLKNIRRTFRNLPPACLYEEAVKRQEGLIGHLGPFVVKTGTRTGRSPEDKFIVKEKSSEEQIWWGKENRPIDSSRFDNIYNRLLAYLQGKDIFVQDCYVGAAKDYTVPLRVITEYAWQSLFASNMFIPIKDQSTLASFKQEFTIFAMPCFHSTPEIDGTKSEAFVIINFGKKLILIGGTGYAGEIKKSVFTVLNYLLPQRKVLSMHCAANSWSDGEIALFFGLSGTGKTTLSTDVERKLIGDDEHGWDEHGVFNFEGGCYAKVIRISKQQEPQIYDCTRKFGTILENVVINEQTRMLDLNDASITENTRASYPLTHLENAILSGTGNHPSNIFMLSCDTFGILPPIALLTPEQAAYYFLQGYTAKVAGTEVGLGKEPKTTFSACFGSPFLALPPIKYAELLIKKIKEHDVKCWLVNTGWVGGEFKGERISIHYSRALIRSAIKGNLIKANMETDSTFGFRVPTVCPGVPGEILIPAAGWENKCDYDTCSISLAQKFVKNSEQFDCNIPRTVLDAGPKLNNK